MQTNIYTNKFDKINFTTMKFSGGEVQVRLEEKYTAFWLRDMEVVIETNLTSSDKVMELLLLTDALRRKGANKISLSCPYLPYARQDRVCYSGEALSLRVICDIINAQNYEWVNIWDAHSDVTLALLNKVDHTEAYELLPSVALDDNPILVAPDLGAFKRVANVAKHYGLSMITAEKVRDPNTGEISGTIINYGDSFGNIINKVIGHEELLIVDDICDGGRTFIELAKTLRGDILTANGYMPKINLYVTHGIFSKGFDVFKGLIDNIYVANSFVEDVPDFVHMNG